MSLTYLSLSRAMQRLQKYRWLLRTSAIFFAAVVWVFAGALHASILLPDEGSFDLEDLERVLADSNTGASSSSSAKTDRNERLPLDGPREDSDQPDQLLFIPIQTSTGGTTSGTSTSTGGIGGTTTSPINSVASVCLSDAELVAWIGSERRFTLPMPPGNELLRPPRG